MLQRLARYNSPQKIYQAGRIGLNNFKQVTIPPEAALVEFYRYRVPAFFVLGLALVVTAAWGVTVIPANWQLVWLIGLIIVFSFVLNIVWQQFRTARLQYKFQAKAEAQEEAHSAPTANPKKLWVELGALFIIALVFNLWISSLRVQWIFGDARYYDGTGWRILAGYQPDSVRPSGYAVLLSYFIRFFGWNYYEPLFFFQAFINSLNGILVFGLARLITNNYTVTRVAGWLCALCPFTAGYTGAILTEIMATFMLTVAFFLTTLIVTRPNIRLYYVLLGIVVLLLLEIRYNFQLYIFVPLGLIILFSPLKLKIRLQNLALVLLMSLAILIPAVVANYTTYNRVILFTKADNFTYSLVLATYYNHGHLFTEYRNLEETSDLIKSKYSAMTGYLECEWSNCPEEELKRQQLKGYLNEYFSIYGGEFAGRTISHLWDEWNQTYLYPYSFPLPDYFSYGFFTNLLNRFYILFLLTGLWYILRYRLAVIPLLSGIGYLWVLQAPFPVEPRYMLPVYPAMLIIASVGLVKTVAQAREWFSALTRRDRPRRSIKWLILPLFNLCLIFVLINLINSDTLENTYGFQLRIATYAFNWFDIPYYQKHLPQLLNMLEDMKGLRESGQPENLAELDTILARGYLMAQDYYKALENANTAIAANPASFETYHWRSRVWEELGQPEKALLDRTKFEELAPADQLIIGTLRN